MGTQVFLLGCGMLCSFVSCSQSMQGVFDERNRVFFGMSVVQDKASTYLARG